MATGTDRPPGVAEIIALQQAAASGTGPLPPLAGPLPELEGLDTDGLLRTLIQEVHAQTWELRALTNLLHDAIVGEMIEP